MVDIYKSLTKYFNQLSNTGYVKQREVRKLFVFTAIQELLDTDFRGLLTEKDYAIINQALYCLYGSSCLIPYPNYVRNKRNRIMYTGSVSELACRVDRLEKTIPNAEYTAEQVAELVTTSLGTKLSTLEGEVNTNTRNITSNTNRINVLENTVTGENGVTTKIDTINQNITNINTEIGNINESIDAMDERLTTAEGKLDKAITSLPDKDVFVIGTAKGGTSRLAEDINEDGNINGVDVSELRYHTLGGEAYDPFYDINEDGTVNGVDVTTLNNIILSGDSSSPTEE